MIYLIFLGHNKWSNIRHVKAAKDLIKNKELLLYITFLQLCFSQKYAGGEKVYCMSMKSRPILSSKVLYKMGQDLLDIQYVLRTLAGRIG